MVGNAPQNGEFLKELQEASARGIVVVNLTQCMSGKVNMGVTPPATHWRTQA
jgi:L-asparaginase